MSHERRVFLQNSNPLEVGSEVILSETDSHHLINVLRLSEDDVLVVVCGATQTQFRATVSLATSPLQAVLGEVIPETPFTTRVESLSVALLKGKKNELVIEKAAELGARNILFWNSTHSIKKLIPSQEKGRLERWQKIAESAAKQSGKTEIPKVHLVDDSKALIGNLSTFAGSKDLYLCCSLTASARNIRRFAEPAGGVHLLLGPEGGLTEQEKTFFIDNKFELISLMPYRLRSETAAVAAVAIAQALWGHNVD